MQANAPPSPEAVTRFLTDRYGMRAGPATPLGAGAWSHAYALTLDGRDVVARFGVHGEDYLKDRLMGGLRSPRLPIPRVLEVGRTPQGWFAVSERAQGTPLDDLDASGMRAVLPALLDVLDAVREIDVSARPGYGLWSPDGIAPHRTWREALLDLGNEPRLPGWRAALEASPTGAAPFHAAAARFRALVADLPDMKQVIHCDLLCHNVLVEGAAVTAVFDWGNSLYGDALYDAAWLLYWWPWYPGWAEIDIRAALDRHWSGAGRIPADLEHRLRCYQAHIGLCAMVYTAFTQRWDDLARNARQTLEVLDA